ncbi:MAG: FHA domain-containing protein, partial [Wujia sp.]
MQVTIKDGKNEERTVALESFGKDVVSFGRHPESDIVLKSGAVSRVHGCFYLENGAWHVKDLDSTNGLKCNNARIDDIIPVNGDSIIISAGEYSDSVRFVFKANNAVQQVMPQSHSNGNQQYSYPNYYQQPVQGYTAPLGMNYYNFLIWFALFFVAIILFVQGMGCLKVASVDTSQRYKYQEYMDDDTIAFLDELSDEIGTSRK